MSNVRTIKRHNISNALLSIFALFTAVYFLYWVVRVTASFDTSGVCAWLELLGRVFISILVQAVPFLLIGVIVSSVMQEIISTETLIRIFPKKSGLGFFVAVLIGAFFPVCDCAIVPVASRLIKKGVPLPCAITFMLAAPLVNPIVIASTYYAFPTQPSIMVLRVFFGVVVALSVGSIFSLFTQKNGVLKQSSDKHEVYSSEKHGMQSHSMHDHDILSHDMQSHSIYDHDKPSHETYSHEMCNHEVNRVAKCTSHSLSCSCCEHSEDTYKKGNSFLEVFGNVLKHTIDEFFEVGKYLIVGAFISAIFQVFISKDMLSTLSDNKVLALAVMMLAAFLFSVCSTSDAFVAKAFLGQFTMNSIMGFLVLGPMLDIKNLLMLSSSFKKAFVIRLVLAIVLTSFLILFLLQ